jgi:glutamate-1-semialdehyde 2,1-aminomutase
MDTLINQVNADLYKLAERFLPGAGLGGYALPEDIRFVFAEGKGARVCDVEGHEYIDYVGGAGALILGHSHPAVVSAAQAQIARGMHMFGTLNDVAIRLAERLIHDIPCAEKVVYATTGSEATAYAMRLARAFTGRDLILKFEGAYHGNHDYALTSTFPKTLGSDPHGQDDTAGRPAGTRSTMLVSPFNDSRAVEHIVKQRRGELAAIIVEPVQRIIPAKPEFLQTLRRVCNENEVLLIFDEVVTGFRLAYGGAQVYYGVTPDLASFGKVIGASGPLACVAGRADILDLSDPRRKGEPDYVYFNGTLHGNPVAAAATLAMLDELAKPGTYERLHAYADTVCVECQKVLDRHRLPAIAEHTGSLWQILFMGKRPQTQADMLSGDAAATQQLDAECMKHGLYVLPGVRRFFSCVHGDMELEDTLKALDMSCRVLSKVA